MKRSNQKLIDNGSSDQKRDATFQWQKLYFGTLVQKRNRFIS